ncbi:MAG: hypothetical protein NC397_04500 [Clostridium sp.]|nr:hypothetical protein [Clostridium sp.]
MKMKFSKRLLSAFLAVLMIVTSIPMFAVTASAADNAVALSDVNMNKYLMAYFKDDTTDGQAVRFATSDDGKNWTPLNNNEKVIAQTQGIKACRDPYLFRGNDGCYYIIATDMDGNNGWWSYPGMGFMLWKSKDLVNWTDETYVDFGAVSGKWYGRVWAPQVIWDASVNKYMVYLALASYDNFEDGTNVDGNADMYYFYCTDIMDTSTYEQPRALFQTPIKDANISATGNDQAHQRIDGDIFYNEADGKYYMYYSDYGDNGTSGTDFTKKTYYAVSDKINGPYVGTIDPQYCIYNDNQMEGFTTYRLADGTVMAFGDLNTGSDESALFKMNSATSFTRITDTNINNIDGAGHRARHGSVVAISDIEYNVLTGGSSVGETSGVNVTTGPIIYTHGTFNGTVGSISDVHQYDYMMNGTRIADGSYKGELYTTISSSKTIAHIYSGDSSAWCANELGTTTITSWSDNKSYTVLTGDIQKQSGDVVLKFVFADGSYEFHKLPVMTNPVATHTIGVAMNYSGITTKRAQAGFEVIAIGSYGSTATSGDDGPGYGSYDNNAYGGITSKSLKDSTSGDINAVTMYAPYDTGFGAWDNSNKMKLQGGTNDPVTYDKMAGYYALALWNQDGLRNLTTYSKRAYYYLDMSRYDNWGVSYNSYGGNYSITLGVDNVYWAGSSNGYGTSKETGLLSTSGSSSMNLTDNTSSANNMAASSYGTATISGTPAVGTSTTAHKLRYTTNKVRSNTQVASEVQTKINLVVSDKTTERNNYKSKLAAVSDPSKYTIDSYNNYRNALLDLECYLNNNTLTSDSNSLNTKLNTAYNNLTKVADFSALESAISNNAGKLSGIGYKNGKDNTLTYDSFVNYATNYNSAVDFVNGVSFLERANTAGFTAGPNSTTKVTYQNNIDSYTNNVNSNITGVDSADAYNSFDAAVTVINAMDENKYTDAALKKLNDLINADNNGYVYKAVTQQEADAYNALTTGAKLSAGNIIKVTASGQTDAYTKALLETLNSINADSSMINTYNAYLTVYDSNGNVSQSQTLVGTKQYGEMFDFAVSNVEDTDTVTWSLELQDKNNKVVGSQKVSSYNGTNIERKADCNVYATAYIKKNAATADSYVLKVLNGYGNVVDVKYGTGTPSDTVMGDTSSSMPFYTFTGWEIKQVGNTNVYTAKPLFAAESSVTITTIDSNGTVSKTYKTNNEAEVTTSITSNLYGWAVVVGGKYQVVAYDTTGSYSFSAITSQTYAPIYKSGNNFTVNGVTITKDNLYGYSKPAEVSTIDDQTYINAKLAGKAPFVYVETTDSNADGRTKIFVRVTANCDESKLLAYGIVISNGTKEVKYNSTTKNVAGQYSMSMSTSLFNSLASYGGYATYSYNYSDKGVTSTINTTDKDVYSK